MAEYLKEKKYKCLPWANHPAVLMWVGYDDALRLYLNAIVVECIQRGVKNTTEICKVSKLEMPQWLGDNRLHSSHRSALLFKDPHYQQFGWTDPVVKEYFWPSKKGY